MIEDRQYRINRAYRENPGLHPYEFADALRTEISSYLVGSPPSIEKIEELELRRIALVKDRGLTAHLLAQGLTNEKDHAFISGRAGLERGFEVVIGEFDPDIIEMDVSYTLDAWFNITCFEAMEDASGIEARHTYCHLRTDKETLTFTTRKVV